MNLVVKQVLAKNLTEEHLFSILDFVLFYLMMELFSQANTLLLRVELMV